MSLVGWLFIAVLVGLGDEFALYIVSHYWVSGQTTGNKAYALASALRRPGPGILLGGLTSAAAFFSLIAMSYPVMVQLGWITSLGLVILLPRSFTVLPLALSFTRPHEVPQSAWFRWTGLAHALGRRPRGLWSIWLLVVIVSTVFAFGGFPLSRTPGGSWSAAIPPPPSWNGCSKDWGRASLQFSCSRPAEPKTEAIARDREATQAMDQIRHRAGVAATVSLSRWLPSPEQQQENIELHPGTRRRLFSADRFRRDFLAAAERMDGPDTVADITVPPAGQPVHHRRSGAAHALTD